MSTVFKKIIGLNNSETIKTLKEMGILRNLCIHNNGVINTEKSKNISQLIRLSNGTLIINNDTIIFNEGSIKFLIEIIKQFFNEIESALKKQTAPEKLANDGSR